MVSSDQSSLPFLPSEAQVSPPPPYPTAQELPQTLLQPHSQEPPAQQPQVASTLPHSEFHLLEAQVSFPGAAVRGRVWSTLQPKVCAKCPTCCPQDSSLTNFFPDVSFDQQSLRPGPTFPPQVSGSQACLHLGHLSPENMCQESPGSPEGWCSLFTRARPLQTSCVSEW